MRASSTRRRHPFRPGLPLPSLALALALVLAACDSSEESAPENTSAAQEASADNSAEHPADPPAPTSEVIRGEGVSLTLGEVEKAVDRLRIFAPRGEDGSFAAPDERWFRTPQAQSSLVNNLLHFKVMRLAAEEWELSITPEDRIKLVREQEQLAPFLPLFEESDESATLRKHLNEAGLSEDDVRHLVDDMVYAEKVHQQLVERFDDEALWAIYEAANDTATLVVVRGTNTPTSREIDEAVVAMADEIEAYYRDNPQRYMRPETARLTVLRPKGGDKPEAVREAARRLEAGEDAEAIAAGLGLELRPEAFLIKPENPAIFEEDAKDIGFEMSGPRGQYAYKVLERIPPQPLELTRPLKREIASHLLRSRGVVDSARRRLEPALGIMEKFPVGEALSDAQIETMVTELENAGFEAVRSEPFSLQGRGLVPGIGLVEDVVQATASLTLNNPTVNAPVQSRDDVYVFRMVDRSRAERDAFEAEREAFRETFMARNAQRFNQEFVQKTRDERNITVNLEPVRQRYPLMSKEEQSAFVAEQNAAPQPAPAPEASAQPSPTSER
ncbi:peptidyl-prolyl cis-trans isomerase [Lujinxingia vulgaris]|uniref:Peptidyl-prolyl cis-trans isomerase n=1 Tax=Lujinxingia vulgaris TaxID=2600176 RepID=A0A5C6X815_9DELT|nr:peptidylprolyl isomerase [Lujinxingia vulgaris]TXD35880.1 peptidyl-prolyl cis-trans isomerase [Lujinxingia vulgaris]